MLLGLKIHQKNQILLNIKFYFLGIPIYKISKKDLSSKKKIVFYLFGMIPLFTKKINLQKNSSIIYFLSFIPIIKNKIQNNQITISLLGLKIYKYKSISTSSSFTFNNSIEEKQLELDLLIKAISSQIRKFSQLEQKVNNLKDTSIENNLIEEKQLELELLIQAISSQIRNLAKNNNNN